jgi:hypothetical protein
LTTPRRPRKPRPQPTTPVWVAEQAWQQVRRAERPEDRARALSTFRHAIRLVQHEAGGDPTPEVVKRLEQLETAARKLYDDVRDEHVRTAVRGLASVRVALSARLHARSNGRDTVEVSVSPFGLPAIEPYRWSKVDCRRLYPFGDESWSKADRIEVELDWDGNPTARLLSGGNVLAERQFHFGRLR